MFFLDSHCDTPSQLLRLRDLGRDNPVAQVDFPKLLRSGLDGAFFALFTPQAKAPDEATRYALQMLAAVYDCVAAHPGIAALAFSPAEARRLRRKGLFSVFIGMENASPIQQSLPLLRQFHRMGVRYVTLCHNGDNAVCDSAAGTRTWQGLSPFGREVVAEMNRLGMIIDLAHASDETFWEVLDRSQAPVVSTHSSCRSLCGHRRNMSDEMIRALAAKGGVIQINFYPAFLSERYRNSAESAALEEWAEAIEEEFIADPSHPDKRRRWEEAQQEIHRKLWRPGVEAVVDHIDHAVSLAGVGHVGIGSDFDGIPVTPKGLEDVSKLGGVFDEMRRRGYSEADIRRIGGENFLRVWESITRRS